MGLAVAAVSGCGSGQAEPSFAEERPPPLAENGQIAEPVPLNAGAGECTVAKPVRWGPLSRPDEERASMQPLVTAGFGQVGGLLVWRNDDGVAARRVDARGEPQGRPRKLQLPPKAMPQAAVAVRGGFVVVGQERILKPSMCLSQCEDPTCSGWMGRSRPVVCHRPCYKPCKVFSHYDMMVEFVPLGPTKKGSLQRYSIGTGTIIAQTLPHEGRFAMMTSTGLLVMATVEGASGVRLTQRQMSVPEYLLPVRGNGPPAFIAIDMRGSGSVIDAEGSHALTGTALGDGGVSVVNARLQARWGSDGKIHLAWSSWLAGLDSYQFAMINERYRVTLDGEPRELRDGIPSPFEDYVVVNDREGQMVRGTWVKTTLGAPIQLPPASAASISLGVEWTGQRFLFLQAESTGEGFSLYTVSADCGT